MNIYNLTKVSLLAIIFMGCSHSLSHNHEAHNHDTQGGNHNHDENFQFTSYNNDFEIFAEVTPLATGEQCEILAHFTRLDNFKPLESGSITATLVTGPDAVRQTLDTPVSTGIYKFSLTPGTSGTGQLVFDINYPEMGGASQLVIPNIEVYSDLHAAQHAAGDAVVTADNSVPFVKEQSWKIDFATEDAQTGPFGQVIRTTAQILPSQGDERVVIAKADGIAVFPAGNIVEGKEVKAGQTLFSIESSDLADNNLAIRYKEAATEYNRTKAEYERKKELAKDQIVSASDLLKAQTEFENAEIKWERLQKNFSAGKQVVSSPINGFVKQVLIRNGEFAQSGQPVLVVSQNSELLVRADLQPKYYGLLHGITSANFRAMNSDRTYTLEELNGKIVSFGKSAGTDNPLIPVIFQVNNSAGFLPGSFVEMYIKAQTNSMAVTIPNESIIEEMGNYFAYIQLTPEYFEKRPIRKGATDGLRTEILEGISANERVVSRGAIMVKLAQSSGALDPHSGHAH